MRRGAALEQVIYVGCTALGRQGLATGEARIEIVPVRYLGLAQPPAQKHLAAIHDAVKVAKLRPLELDAQPLQLLDVRPQLLFLGVELGLALRQLFGVQVLARVSGVLSRPSTAAAAGLPRRGTGGRCRRRSF